MTGIILTYCLVGSAAGVMAGLLGIGGGLVIVPILIYTFSLQGADPELIMHLALATSMASIIFTSISSFWAHHRRGAVQWGLVAAISPGILIGTFLGACFVSTLATDILKLILVVFLYGAAAQLLTGRRPKADREMVGWAGLFCAGSVIGAVSSMVGIGGGSLSVPFMVRHNITIHHAIGTSAAIGFPIALAGTAGYVFSGWGNSALPAYCLGYVYLPALAGISLFTFVTAPVGVMLAHRLDVKKLKRIFALLLIVVATRMVVEII
ncbi:MAG: sulfite exporter TauE/SafE family protein [Thermodesulfobacteriota bacterium]